MFSWQAFHFLRPEWLWLLLPVVWIIYVTLTKEDNQRQWKNIIAPHIIEHISLSDAEYRRFNPITASIIALLIMVVILAGPSWTRQQTPFSQDASSLVIMLDASTSMDQSDIQPTRLERSKQKIADLLALRTGSNTALIVFGGSSHTVLPLSNDKDILINYLQAITPSIIPVDGKFPEKALEKLPALGSNPNAPLTLLWIGDGYGSQSTTAFKEYFLRNDQQLLILGVGKSQQQLSSEADSQTVPLEEAGLQAIANEVGGRYVQATVDTADVYELNGYINSLYVELDDKFSPWFDHGYYLVFIMMPLFLLWFRRGWTLHWGLVVCMSLSMWAPHEAYASEADKASENNRVVSTWADKFIGFWLTSNQHGHWNYYQGHYVKAAVLFQDVHWKAIAYYQAEEFALAAEYFSRVEGREGRFGLANSLAHSQHYLKAVAVYDQLLKEWPNDNQLKNNRDVVQAIIDAINLMSESQRTEEDGGGSKELGADDPKRADGAEFQTFSKEELKQLSADDILADESLQDMWMRNVQPNPASFLATKFSIQQSLNADKMTTNKEKNTSKGAAP